MFPVGFSPIWFFSVVFRAKVWFSRGERRSSLFSVQVSSTAFRFVAHALVLFGLPSVSVCQYNCARLASFSRSSLVVKAKIVGRQPSQVSQALEIRSSKSGMKQHR